MALRLVYCGVIVLLFISPSFGIELANICDLLKCENGGACVTDGDEGFCQCLPGFTGYRCENDINLCQPNPCFNSGTCLLDQDGNNRRCFCRPGFFGENCERGPCGKECSAKYQPVCGSDGFTYQNGCELEKASCLDNTLICASLGECPAKGCRCKCMPVKDPVCGTDCITYENECELNNVRKCSKPSLRKSYDGDCRAFICGLRKPYKCNTCLRLTGPVCGSDGKIYSSECQLRVKACKKKNLHMVPCPSILQVRNNTCDRPAETKNMFVFVSSGGITINQVRKVENGAQVEFTCGDGFSLFGESVITCRNGNFDRPIPKCYRRCNNDPISNGKAIGAFEHKTEVKFECNQGYTLEGSSLLICSKGEYNDSIPICQANCKHPGSIENGIVEGSIHHSDIIKYSCSEGFTLVGRDITTCVDGIWTYDKPHCYENCEPVSLTSELSSTGGFEHGMSLQFQCVSGFTMYGDTSIKCTNGKWSSSAPICLAGCESPNEIANGNFQGSFDHGGKIVIYCDDGYSVVGTNIISCANGELSDPIPVCRKNCHSIPVEKFRIHVGQYNHGSVIKFDCTDGRSLYGANEIVCDNGVYSDEPPHCYAKCLPVGIPEHGQQKGSNEHGKTLTFSCDEGFKLIGEKSVKCFDGIYSAEVPPLCYENCNNFSLPNGEIEGVAEHGNNIVFKCNEDFTLVGRLSTLCTDGVLTHKLPECKRNCFPFDFANGKYIGSITHGSEILFSCNDGFSLVGTSRLECFDGQYSSIIPACYENCDDLVSPLNGFIIGDVTHGEAVNYDCYSGYTLVGPSFRTCTDGSWDSLAPTCHADCDRPQLIFNGEVNSDLSHGGKTTFTCRDGYTLVGVTSTFCLDGQYQDQFPACYANCEAAISIANGLYTGSFNHGGSIIFTCDVGYTLVGESTITCDNGQYSSSYAECKANCERPPLVLNGEVNSDASHGGKTSFTCRDGYTLVGVASTLCLDGQYQDQFPVCYANCEASISISNGQYTGSYNHGGSIIFTCDVGYTLVGELRITCDNGLYSSSFPECKANCERPQLVLNGEVNSDLSHGAKTTFTCRDGYTLVGVNSTLCLDGQYQDQFPECYDNCDEITSISNGEVSGNFSHGGVLKFKCNDGYTIVGSPILSCSDGIYNTASPVCRANCERPLLILNGDVTSDLSHGGKTTFTCRDGYTLVGVTSTLCLDGQYQDQFPVCYANCKASISIVNGQYTGSFSHGGSIIFTCDVGYTLVGESTITCDNGQYSSSYAECKANCDRPPLILNGEVNSDLSHGGKTTFTCRDGYTLVGVTSTLCLDGQYQDKFPVCYANCKASISIVNGQYTGSFNHGGSIIFTCDVGYTLVGESTITCDNGQYSSSNAECKANCERPPLVLNGVVNSDLSHGGKTTFTCRDGYTLVGVTSTLCLDGQYQDQFPVCYANCKASISIVNGQYTGSFNHGGSIIFTCDVGYTLVGESTITCDNGQYSSSYAECKANCQSPPLVINGLFNGTIIHGGVIRYKCFEGYTLDGNEYLNCIDGSYIEQPPSCIADCQDPGTPLAGFRYTSSLSHNGIIHFGCLTGFTLQGSESLICQNGLWNTTIPQCSPCDEGATYFNGSCYNLQYRRKYYDDAEYGCENNNGHLATFTSHQELMAVNTDALFGLRFYIGVKAQVDNWGRETSENSDYFNWPNHNCAYHTTGNINRWNNLIPCTDKKQFICETPRPCFTDIRCFAKSIQYNGHCYQVEDIRTRNWMDAHKYCQSSNGNLVVISNLEEQEAVNELLNECGPFPENQFWIGLNRQSIDSQWSWVTPSVPYEFKYWPDFRCAYINSQEKELPWYYSTCDDFTFASICQKSAALYEDIFNPCESNPCVNGGTCFSKVTEDFSDYYCHCPTGLEGKNCEDKDSCNGFRCANNKCVQCMFTCNRIDNCGDNSDEEACIGSSSKCNP